MTVSAHTGAINDKEYVPAEWSYNELGNLEPIWQPLDKSESEHVLASAVKAVDRAVMSEAFGKIEKDYYCTIFEHDEEEIERK